MAFNTLSFTDRNYPAASRRRKRASLDLVLGFLIAAILMFKVATADAATMSASPASVAAGADVTTTWSAIGTPTSKDWIGLYVPGSSNSSYLAQRYTTGTAAGSVPFTIPSSRPAGTYELRLFSNNSYTQIGTSNSFAITTSTASLPASLSASPASVAPGADVTTTWSAIGTPTSKDWIGLYVPGSSNSSYLAQRYTTGTAAGSVPFTIPSSRPAGTYELRLFSNNSYTRIGTSNAFAVGTAAAPAPDTQAPSVPAGLTGTALSANQIRLNWSAATDNVGVTGYYVYLNDVALGTTTATTYTHSGLTAGTTYNYRVSAYDAAPNHSAWTAAPVAVTTTGGVDTQAPSVPSGLTGTALSANQIRLTWNAATDNVGVTGYYVYLNDVALGTTTATTFTHSGLAAGTVYNYRVSAYDAVPNHSAWTATPVSVATSGGSGGGGTGATKFIPTFAVYYGGGPALVAADAARLAKFDLIDIDRFRYNSISGNTWAAIKAINPNVKIYLYTDGTETHNQQDSMQQLYTNTISRFNVSRGHTRGSLNGNNPALFLLDTSGARVYNAWFSSPGSGQYFYLMDFGSPTYVSYWVEAVRADIANQPWAADGVFADICMTFPAAAGHNTLPAKYPSNTAWSAAMNTFSAGAAAGLAGFNQKLWCNKGDTGSPEGKAAWLALDASATPPDALMEEGAFAVEWGNGQTQFYPEATWKSQVDALAATNNSKATYISHTKLSPGGSGTDNYGRPVTYTQTLWYSIGSFLLGKNDTRKNSYFMFYGAGAYSTIWWHEEYDRINLGAAVGPYTVTNIGGTNVYRREFQLGWVYVNPTGNNVATITLPQNLRRLTPATLATPTSAPMVNAIALNAHEAAFLLK